MEKPRKRKPILWIYGSDELKRKTLEAARVQGCMSASEYVKKLIAKDLDQTKKNNND